MRYVCLVYGAESRLAELSPDEIDALIEETEEHTRELRASGHLVLAQALEQVDAATTVRVRGGQLSATDGPFAETVEQLGGFVFIEARDLNEAIRIAGADPGRPVRQRRGAAGDRPHARALVNVARGSTGPSRARCWPRSSGSSATSTSPRRRCRTRSRRPPNGGGDEPPANPRAWLVSTGRFKAIDRLRRRARFDKALGELALLLEADEPAPDPDLRRRPAPADLHLLPSRAPRRRPGGDDAARGVRADHGGDRPGLPHRAADRGAADRPGEGEDQDRGHPVRGAGARRAARPARRPCCASSTWSSPRGTRPPRATRSSAPTWPTRRSGSAACWSSCCPTARRRAAGADAAAGLAPGRARHPGRRPRPAGRPGPVAVGPRPDRRGRRAARGRRRGGPYAHPGRDRRRPRRGARRPPPPTGTGSSRCTTRWPAPTRRRWSR